MKFALNKIKKDAYNGPFTFEERIELPGLAKLHSDIRNVSDILVQGECEVQGYEIIFTLTISGEFILPCARTLVDVPYLFKVNEVEVYSESPYYGKEEEENEVHQIVGEVIDLTPQIQENVLLAVPFRVFSEDEEVIRSSTFEGDGWEFKLEEEHEDAQQEKIDPRLKKLKTLLDDENKDT